MKRQCCPCQLAKTEGLPVASFSCPVRASGCGWAHICNTAVAAQRHMPALSLCTWLGDALEAALQCVVKSGFWHAGNVASVRQ